MGSGLLWYGQASGGQPLPRAPHSFLAPAGPSPISALQPTAWPLSLHELHSLACLTLRLFTPPGRAPKAWPKEGFNKCLKKRGK